MRRLTRAFCDERGQATVEAAYSILAFFVMLVILVQPAIWLYTRAVMGSAAAHTARVVITASGGSIDDGKVKLFAKRRLQAVPPIPYFKVGGVDAWDIEWSGGGNSEQVTVTISVEQQPLPILDVTLKAIGLTNSSGNTELTVKATIPGTPAGVDPSGGWEW